MAKSFSPDMINDGVHEIYDAAVMLMQGGCPPQLQLRMARRMKVWASMIEADALEEIELS